MGQPIGIKANVRTLRGMPYGVMNSTGLFAVSRLA